MTKEIRLINKEQEHCDQFSSKKRAVDQKKLEDIRTHRKHKTIKDICYRDMGLSKFYCYTNILNID